MGGCYPDAAERLYEIGFDGDVRDEVQLISPAAQVRAMPTHTVLWSRVRRSEDFDTLLDSLLGMGITPREVYESADGVYHALSMRSADRGASGDAGTGDELYCEVRIRGSLGEATLRYLGWSHRITKTTVVLLRATHEALGSVLTQMSAIARLDYVLAL